MQYNKEQIQEILDKTNLNLKLDQVEELLQHNIIPFEYKGEKYRVKKPTFGQKKEAYARRNKVLMELIKDNNYMYEKDLRKLLKETRNIDIDELDNRYMVLIDQQEAKQVELAKLLEQKADTTKLELYRDEILKIESQKQVISFEKAQHLETSIENQIDTEVYLYLAYLLTEIAIEQSGQPIKWVRAWNKYEDFLQEYEELIDSAAYAATIVSQNEIRK